MISLDKKSRTIEFTPRRGFSKEKPLSLELVYGHVCPDCNNVMQAYFKTPEPIDLWAYEETRQMVVDVNNPKLGELRSVVPDAKSTEGRTQYNNYFDSKNGAQKIVLKNHILKYNMFDVKDPLEKADWEPGGKMCQWAGLFSLREDLMVRDYIYFSRINAGKLYSFGAKSLKDFKFQPNMKVCGFPVPAVGEAPDVILIRYDIVNRGFENSVERFLGHTKTP